VSISAEELFALAFWEMTIVVEVMLTTVVEVGMPAPDKDLARQRCRDCREQIGVGGARVGAPILPQPASRQRDARVRQSSQRCRA